VQGTAATEMVAWAGAQAVARARKGAVLPAAPMVVALPPVALQALLLAVLMEVLMAATVPAWEERKVATLPAMGIPHSLRRLENRT
jgi:hypothetical protein